MVHAKATCRAVGALEERSMWRRLSDLGCQWKNCSSASPESSGSTEAWGARRDLALHNRRPAAIRERGGDVELSELVREFVELFEHACSKGRDPRRQNRSARRRLTKLLRKRGTHANKASESQFPNRAHIMAHSAADNANAFTSSYDATISAPRRFRRRLMLTKQHD